MRLTLTLNLLAALVLSGFALPHKHSNDVPPPTQFEIARHTFFDFGPPNDFYELFFVRAVEKGTSIERITLTPAANRCFAPAKVETASALISIPLTTLLGGSNPCLIPEKQLRRELKRCKHCLAFSGANVTMQVPCGPHTRLIRADVLDKDWFAQNPRTPPNTSWTIRLLQQMDQALGSNVMDKPMFALPSESKQDSTNSDLHSQALQEIVAGKYDHLFAGTPDKPSLLAQTAGETPPAPTVELTSVTPVAPDVLVLPKYPPIARMVHLDGSVSLSFDLNSEGRPINILFDDPLKLLLLHSATNDAVPQWVFAKSAIGQKIHATIQFSTHCPPDPPKSDN